jgi:hypothetical protein
MALPAVESSAVWTPLALPIGMTGEHQQPLGLAGVDPAEGGGGEGHEQPWMASHPLRDTLAAAQPGRQELELVTLVGRRAGGAHRDPAVAARLEQGGVRLPVGVIDGTDLAGLRVGVLDPAAQPHRVSAVAGGGHLLGPPLIAGTGPIDHLLQDGRQQLPDLDRLTHPVPSSSRKVGASALVAPRRASARRASSARSRSFR